MENSTVWIKLTRNAAIHIGERLLASTDLSTGGTIYQVTHINVDKDFTVVSLSTNGNQIPDTQKIVYTIPFEHIPITNLHKSNTM